MSKSLLKVHLRRFCRCVMNRVISEVDEEDLGRSAIVFSPHPDDETLGCGGTIIKKRRVGAEVNIFFMTDGGKSHRHLMSEKKLKAIRENEALAASRTLGLKESNVVFLGFEDGELSKNQASATYKVMEILLSQQPDEIFIPYCKEPAFWSEDHLATNRIVTSALQRYGGRAVIYEYPVWFWYHWPWVSVPIHSRREFLNFLKNSLIGLNSLRDFRCSVHIGDILELKRAALDQYKSQMTRLIPDPRWLTLGDVSNGEFLEFFFQKHEIFHQYILHG